MSTLDSTVPPKPHVIFLDLNMPLKNGFECLKEIRETPKLKEIPVVVFSTTDNPNTVDITYDLGSQPLYPFMGFHPQYKSRIFEVFQRLHDKQKIPGTGIGLVIVKKIAENHNFITLTGELNKGATFDIYLTVILIIILYAKRPNPHPFGR